MWGGGCEQPSKRCRLSTYGDGGCVFGSCKLDEDEAKTLKSTIEWTLRGFLVPQRPFELTALYSRKLRTALNFVLSWVVSGEWWVARFAWKETAASRLLWWTILIFWLLGCGLGLVILLAEKRRCSIVAVCRSACRTFNRKPDAFCSVWLVGGCIFAFRKCLYWFWLTAWRRWKLGRMRQRWIFGTGGAVVAFRCFCPWRERRMNKQGTAPH